MSDYKINVNSLNKKRGVEMEKLDLRTPEEKSNDRTKSIVRLIMLAVIACGLLVFTGCAGLGEVADLADESWDAVEDLTWTASDVTRDVGEIKRAVSRAKYSVTVVNSSCADYRGEDEAKNRFLIPSGEITVITVESARRGDERVSLLFHRSDNRADCRASEVGRGKIDRNNEEIVIG